MQPITANLQVYKGADFSLSFRLKEDGSAVSLTGKTVTFNAAEKPGGVRVWSYDSDSSPEYVTVDSTDLVTIAIPASVTEALTQSRLYFNIDVDDDRWWMGSLELIEGA
jgi:hypothetical protein